MDLILAVLERRAKARLEMTHPLENGFNIQPRDSTHLVISSADAGLEVLLAPVIQHVVKRGAPRQATTAMPIQDRRNYG